MRSHSGQSGFIPDIYCVLRKYNLLKYINTHRDTCIMSPKSSWKKIVNNAIAQFYQTKWRHHITGDPDFGRFRNVHKTILISALWLSEDIQNAQTTVCVLTNNRPTDGLPCEYCGRVNSNRQWHILTECYITHNKRANLLVKRTFLGEGVQAIPPLMTLSVLYVVWW